MSTLSKMTNAQLRALVTTLRRENEALTSEKNLLTKRLADIRDGEDRVLARLDETLRRLPGISLQEKPATGSRRAVKEEIIKALWDNAWKGLGEELKANKIEGIKALRTYDGSLLVPAKNRIESLMTQYPTRLLLETVWLKDDSLFL